VVLPALFNTAVGRREGEE
jgi:hypothetical protein